MQYVSLIFHSSTGSSKKDASILSRLKIYQESGPIKDTRVVVVLRTGNTGFPNVAPCLFIGKDVGLGKRDKKVKNPCSKLTRKKVAGKKQLF